MLIAGCGQSIPEELKPAIAKYHLNTVDSSDLTSADTSRALSQLSRESCNRDAMYRLAARLKIRGTGGKLPTRLSSSLTSVAGRMIF